VGVQHAGVLACWQDSRKKIDRVTKSGIWMRNRPHGLTRVPAKTGRNGQVRGRTMDLARSMSRPQFIRTLKSKLHGRSQSFRPPAHYISLAMRMRHKLDKSRSTCTDQGVQQLVRRRSGLFTPPASKSGLLVDLVPAVYQRLSDRVQPRLLVVIFIRLITDYVLCRPSIAWGKWLIPAGEAELGRQDRDAVRKGQAGSLTTRAKRTDVISCSSRWRARQKPSRSAPARSIRSGRRKNYVPKSFKS
jgi:hypothetical protein